MSNKTQPGAWTHYIGAVLEPKVKALSRVRQFPDFQRCLCEIVDAFAAYCQGRAGGEGYLEATIKSLRSPADVEAFTHAPVLAAIVRTARKPWGWNELCRAMSVPAGRVHVARRGKKRRLPRKITAARFIHEEFSAAVTPRSVENDRAAAYVEFEKEAVARDGRFVESWTPAELIFQLDQGLLPASIGERIAREYQAMRQRAASEGGKGKARAAEQTPSADGR